MARERELRLVVTGTDKGAGRTLDQVERKAGHLGRGLKTLGVVAGGTFAVLGVAAVRQIARSVQGLEEHNRVVRQTAAAVKSTGGAANVSTKQVTRLSDALERKTTIDGDVIQSGANMLLTFTNVRNELGRGNDIFTQATKTVLDMSAALGQDTKNSAIQLGKALNDPVKGVTALQRVGVTFTAQQRDQIKTLVESGRTLDAQKVILAELNKEFGGSAAAAATPMGRLAVLGRQLSDTIGGVFLPALNTVSTGLLNKFGPALAQIGETQGPRAAKVLDDIAKRLVEGIPPADQIAAAAGRVADKLREVGPQLATGIKTLADRFRDGASGAGELDKAAGGLHDSVRVAGTVVGFLADHTDTLARALPALVVGIGLYKTAQAAANLAAAAEVFLAPARIASNFAVARSVRALAVAQRESTGATVAGTVITQAATGATNIGTLALLRQKAATLASAVASKVAAAAALVWRGAQVALNFALAANPIGLVILAIAALAAGIIYAYKHSETFRRIVDSVWRGVKASVGAAVDFIIKAIRFWLNVQIGVVQGILHVMGKLPGPMGAPFRKAEDAVIKAKGTINTQLDKVQERVNRLRGKDLNITAHAAVEISASTRRGLLALGIKGYGTKFFARGGKITDGTGPTADDVLIRASKHETVVSAEDSRDPWFKGWAHAKQIPGYQHGGIVGGFLDPAVAATRRYGELAATEMGRVAGREIGKAVASAVRFTGGTGAGFGSGSWTRAIAELRREHVPYTIISTFRPGARTHASGNVSFHALNRAVDLDGGHDKLRIWRALTDTFPTELIYSRAPLYKSRSGWHPISRLDPITRADHYSHVHAAYRRGGLVMDSGGYLQPGWNPPIYNGTGRPEPVGAAGGITIHFHGPVYGDRDTLARMIRSSLKAQLKREGKPLANQL